MPLCETCGGEDARAALADTVERLVIANTEKDKAVNDETEAVSNLGRCFLRYQKTCSELQNVVHQSRKDQFTMFRLRNVIKLVIGRQTNVPWSEVPEKEVDAYLAEMERLEAMQLEQNKEPQP